MPELNLPTPGVTPGTGWAFQVNAAFNTLNNAVENVVGVHHLVADYIVGADQEWTGLDVANPPQSAVLRALSTATNRPPGSSAFMVLHMRGNDTNITQIAVGLSSDRPVYVRAKTSASFTAWVRVTDQTVLDARVAGLIAELALTTDAELDARVAGLVEELHLATAVKCVHLDGGAWVWDGPAAAAATHYVLPDDTGALIVRPTPFPTPLATPALNW